MRIVDNLSTGKLANINPRAAFIKGDVSDAGLMRHSLHRASGCFHLAAVASVARGNEAWLQCHRTNVGGTVSVLEAARDVGRLPVVYASSAAVYGEQPVALLHEALPPRPASAYGADKFGSEQHARVAFAIHGVPTQGFRFFNVYGPRQDPRSPYSGVISIFAGALRDGRAITVNGDGLHVRDYIHVSDIVRFLMAGMQRLDATPTASVLNACTGEGTSVLDILRLVSRALGKMPIFVHGPARPGDVRASVGDPAGALAELGLSAIQALDRGLSEMLFAAVPQGVRMAS